MKQFAAQSLKKALTQAGIQFQVYSANAMPLPLWDSDTAFIHLWRQMNNRTLVDKRRCFMLYQIARQVSTLTGDVAEIGVYRGGTAYLLAHILSGPTRHLHLFDTFSGMPSVDPGMDLHSAGDFRDTSLNDVRTCLSKYSDVHIHPGFFPQTATPVADKSFCFVHVDVDIHQSVLDCCAFFYPRLVQGGMMLFDDYGWSSCPGAKLAVDAFFADKPEFPCYLPTGQAFVVRL
jgi:O-methyltransferase